MIRIPRLLLGLACGCLVSMFVLGTMSTPASAQTTTAAIQGTVTDISGATVPGATVRATNKDTGLVRTATTNNVGLFYLPALPIGTYELRCEKSGFKTIVQQGVVLTVGSQRVVNFAMQVGAVEQSVTVRAEGTQVNTTSAQVSTLIDSQQLKQLPLNGRDVDQLVLLAPGVNVYTGIFQGPFYGGGFTYTVGGARPNGQGEELDGANVQDYFNHGAGAGALNSDMGADAVAEFRILTNTYSARYGGNGSELVEVTKSGTNAFHGSVYEFLRNSALDANNYFNNAAGKPIPPFRRNQFGAAVGGPIKKNKMFFFFNYEGLRQLLGETDLINLPDANAHNGYLPNSSGQYVCVNNSTITYPDTACANSIPTSVQPYLNFYTKFYPVPTKELTTPSGLPTGIGQETVNPSQTGHENYFVGRYDWHVSATDSMFARYLGDFADLGEPSTGTLPGVWPSLSRNRNQFFTVQETHIFSSSLLNTVSFSFARPFQDSATGINSYPIFQYYPGQGLVDGGMSITGLTGFGPAAPGPWHFIQNKFAEEDDLLWTKGAHSLAFGGKIDRIQNNVWSPIPGQGTFSFQSLSSFLAGIPFYFNGILPGADGKPQANASRNFREIDFALYAQDDWRVRSNLNLNLGIRWEPTTNPVDTAGDLHSIINAPEGGYVNVTHVFAHNPSLHNFAPRVGVAWAPFKSNKTSVRAGFGMFHDLVAARDFAAEYYNNPPFKSGFLFFPANFPSVPSGPSQVPPSQFFGISYYLGTTPYIEQWNLTVQQQILPNTIVSLGYVGSHGVHQIAEYDANYPVPTILADGQKQYSSLKTVNGRTSIVQNPLINPAYGQLQIADSIGWSKYNSAQLAVDSRLAGGLDAHLSYTYSSCTDNDSGSYLVDGGTVFSNPFNYRADAGWCSYYLRNNVTFNASYPLPFRSNNLFVRGWQVSGIVSYHSGFPVTLTDGFAQAYSGGGANRPNAVAGCNPVNSNPEQSKGVFWVNTSCYTLPPVGILGNLGRNTLIGPTYADMDMAIAKTTQITKISEQFAIQFRAEFFNLFDRTNFGSPAGGLFVQELVNGNATGGGLPNPTAGEITSIVGTPRQIQFGLRILF
jgi:hypothetical protein